MAAAMGNVYPEDNWKVHFRDTMRGGKLLNNCRMAELHAQEAPDRVRELEAWGALFDRTKDGLILQRDFGGHRYARLAHVGDRTGLELIRTMQQKAVADGMEVFMELKVLRLLHDADGTVSGLVGYWRPTGKFVVIKAKSVVLATGGVGKSWMYTSNSWESTGDGHAMALWAGADLIDMECVQFHPTGMVWPPVGAGHPGDRGRPRRRRRAAQLRGHPLHVRLRPRHVPGRDGRLRGRGRQVVRRPHRRPAAAGAPAPRRGRPLDQLRGQGGTGQSPRWRLPRHRHPAHGRGHPSPAALDVPPVQGARRRRHHRRSAWRSVRPATTSWVASGSTPTRPRPPSRDCSRPARWPAACTAPTAWAATRSRTSWSSGAAPASAPPSSPGTGRVT